MIDLTRILAEARKGFLRRAADPWALAGWLAVPLLLGTLVTSITGRGQVPRAHLLIADLDESLISSFLVSALTHEQLAEVLLAEKVSVERGRERLEEGEASGLLVIPEGFGERFLRDQPDRLELVTNPSQRILPRILEETLDLLADAGFYLHRAMGEELDLIAGADSISEADTAAMAIGIRRKMLILGPALQENPIVLDVVRPEEEGPRPGFALLLFPGLALMAMFFTAQGLVEEFWDERELGTLRRLAASPGGAGRLLGGRLLAVVGVQFVIGAAVLIPGFLYHGIPAVLFGPASLWLTLSGTVLFLLLAVLQLMGPSRRAASLISQMVIFPLLMVGGSFFPLEALPSVIATFGKLTPNGFMTERLKDLLVGGQVLDLLLASSLLWLTGAVLFAMVRALLTPFARH